MNVYRYPHRSPTAPRQNFRFFHYRQTVIKHANLDLTSTYLRRASCYNHSPIIQHCGLSMEPQSLQRDVTRLCIQCGILLLQHGAESALVDELSTRLGLALGMDSVESAISANAIVLTTIQAGHCLTSTRKNSDRGINMHVVTQVQHIVIMAEHRLLDSAGVAKNFSRIKPFRYTRWQVVLMVGLLCSCFCKLNGGGWNGATVAFIAASVAMLVRQLLTHRQFHPQINFCLTAFVATSISGLLLRLPLFLGTSAIAMAASVLLLVPGFPLINVVADMFKGHVNTGLARWAMASLLTLATCIGVVMAMSL